MELATPQDRRQYNEMCTMVLKRSIEQGPLTEAGKLARDELIKEFGSKMVVEMVRLNMNDTEDLSATLIRIAKER